MLPRSLLRVCAWALLLVAPLRADPPVPKSIVNPATPAEAWNVLRLATGNVERLLAEQRLEEIPVQISYCAPSLRLLPPYFSPPDRLPHAEELVRRALVSVNAVALAAQQGNSGGVRNALGSLRTTLSALAQGFEPAVARAEIYICPVHPDLLSADAKAPCPKCGLGLLARRIPYSAVYIKPGEPTVRLTASTSGPIEAGKPVEVKLRLAKADGTPVLTQDLIETHAHFIHALLEEPGLGDYHHALPQATGVPGEYAFSFTPAKAAPYRLWADIVPRATGVQELPSVDLPATAAAGKVEKTADQLEATAGGYRFALRFPGSAPLPARAGQARATELYVTNAAGQPVTTLEPFMNAFAHLVGFYDDFRTIVHLHPAAGEVLDAARRGGPSLEFTLFAPRAGFLRLYAEVRIEGQSLRVPFSVNVAE